MASIGDLMVTSILARGRDGRDGVDVFVWAPRRVQGDIVAVAADAARRLHRRLVALDFEGPPTPRGMVNRIPHIVGAMPMGVPPTEVIHIGEGAESLGALRERLRPGDILLIDADRVDEARAWEPVRRLLAESRNAALSRNPIVLVADLASLPLPGITNHCVNLEMEAGDVPLDRRADHHGGHPVRAYLTIDPVRVARRCQSRTWNPLERRLRQAISAHLLRDREALDHPYRAFTSLNEHAYPSLRSYALAGSLLTAATLAGIEPRRLLNGTIGAWQTHRLTAAGVTAIATAVTPPSIQEASPGIG